VNEQDNILDQLITALSQRRNGQKKETTGALPVPYTPADSLPTPTRPGIFQRILDPTAAAKSAFEREQLRIMLETRLKALRYEANGFAETIRIDQEHRVEKHVMERREQRDVEERYAKARAEMQKHVLQQNLMTELADYNLDPMEEQLLIAKIVRIMMTPNGTENHNGRDK
jgi:hypothetical protein